MFQSFVDRLFRTAVATPKFSLFFEGQKPATSVFLGCYAHPVILTTELRNPIFQDSVELEGTYALDDALDDCVYEGTLISSFDIRYEANRFPADFSVPTDSTTH